MDPVPLPIQTVYADLVQQVHSRPPKPGSLYRRRLKGTDYVYLKRQIGHVRQDIFIGRADDALTITAVEYIKTANLSVGQQRKLVTLLRASGLPVPAPIFGSVLEVFEDAGLLRDCVLVGTGAYQCYPPLVGHRLPAMALTTQDADLATASLALSPAKQGESMGDILKRADPKFEPVAGLDPRALPSRFRSSNGFIVDLLTPYYRRTDTNPMPISNLKAGAVPLQQLDWLIESPIQAVALHGIGIPVFVPAPARFAIHKLIIAQKRGDDRIKRQKDLLQAKSLIEVLRTADRWSLLEAFREASEKGVKGWRQPMERSLNETGMEISDILP